VKKKEIKVVGSTLGGKKNKKMVGRMMLGESGTCDDHKKAGKKNSGQKEKKFVRLAALGIEKKLKESKKDRWPHPDPSCERSMDQLSKKEVCSPQQGASKFRTVKGGKRGKKNLDEKKLEVGAACHPGCYRGAKSLTEAEGEKKRPTKFSGILGNTGGGGWEKKTRSV